MTGCVTYATAWWPGLSINLSDATPEEQPELWRTMTAVWPDYDAYQQRTHRKIPVVVLERA